MTRGLPSLFSFDSSDLPELMAFDCLISFGSNLGDGSQQFNAVFEHLSDVSSFRNPAASRLVRTAAVGGSAQPDYVNACIRMDSELAPAETLSQLIEIEQRLGRVRDRRWEPRTVDLDLLLAGAEVYNSSKLTIPHPRMTFRRFVLEPAVEVAADMMHPLSLSSVGELLGSLNSASNRMLICSDDTSAADLVEQIQADPNGNDWLFTVIPNPRAIAAGGQTKLLVADQSLFGQNPWMGHEYRGPAVSLDLRDRESAAAEIFAAISAMKPL